MTVLYNNDLVKQAQLASGIDDSQTTMTVVVGQGVTFIQPRCLAVLSDSRSLGDLQNAEHVVMASRSGDVYTIERAIVGTAQSWSAGAFVLGYWSPEHFTEIERSLNRIEGFLAVTTGRHVDGVVRNSGNTYLEVTDAGVGFETVVAPGWAMINDQVFSLSASTGTIPTSVSDDTYTVYAEAPTQLLPDGRVSFLSGTSAPGNTLKLAEVVMVSNVATITDSRTYL